MICCSKSTLFVCLAAFSYFVSVTSHERNTTVLKVLRRQGISFQLIDHVSISLCSVRQLICGVSFAEAAWKKKLFCVWMFCTADRNRLRNLLITNSPSSVDEHCQGIPHFETLLIFQLLVVENCWVWVQNTRSKLCLESYETDVSWSAICDWLFAP